MPPPAFPSLYQINTRVWLNELGRQQGRPATLDDVPDSFLDGLVRTGFDWLWPLGVWQTGDAGRAVSRSHPGWRREYLDLLPDLTENDITGSPFGIQSYTVNRDFGGDAALARFRRRLQDRGVRLLLDFVPNHTALDHPWVRDHPEYYIAGTADDLQREPHNWCRVETRLGPRVLGYGRDPYFPGWPDTAQLNYRSAAFRQAMTAELLRIADRCDAVRCDMAMLVLPDVIHRTWGDKSQPSDGTAAVDRSFWPEAVAAVRGRHPGFVFMAEVYWDLEWTLQQEGFDYTYDKRLYDRLHARDAEGVRGHLWADPDFQKKSVRFLENHDEPRAAGAFPPHVHRAAAVIAFLVPGLHFFHEGQFEGRRQRVSVHLGRRPAEPIDPAVKEFYSQLVPIVNSQVVKQGRWRLLDCRRAWDDNPTWKQFLSFLWEGPGGERMLTVVNFSHTQGQCYVQLPLPDLGSSNFLLRDRLSPAQYERPGGELTGRGLYVDMPEWHYHVFEMIAK
jgi:hypothetical protein